MPRDAKRPRFEDEVVSSDDELTNTDDRNFERVLIDIAKAFQEISMFDVSWQNNRKRGNVEYVLTCLFNPKSFKSNIDPQIDELSVEFKLVRIEKNARPKTDNDGLPPLSQIPLCEYIVHLERAFDNKIFKATGNLRTNIVKYNIFGRGGYETFEGRNYAKIVMYAAIMALAKAKVYHKIHCAAKGTEKIMERFSNEVSSEMQKRNWSVEKRPLTFSKANGDCYDLCPRGYILKGPDFTDKEPWQLLVDAAKSSFSQASQPGTKFRVEAPAPSPYLVSSTCSYFLFL